MDDRGQKMDVLGKSKIKNQKAKLQIKIQKL